MATFASTNDACCDNKSLLYFGHAPMEGAGSAIIVLRHLRRLTEAGWRIAVVGDWGQERKFCRQEGWRMIHLPHRKPWWPPYRASNQLLRTARLWLWAGECRRLLKNFCPNAVVTYLSAFSDFMSQIALAYSRRYGIPLSVIAHDDPASFAANHDEGLATRGRYQAIVQSAQQVWCASPQLAKLYQLRDEARATLPPIPDGFAATPAWKPEFANSPLLVYAGNYWPAQLPLLGRIAFQLAKIGGRLMLVVKGSSEIKALCSEAPVLWREPFAENRQALRFLADSAAGLLVSYSETSDSMPWIRTSFPSKLIEYTHLGLPIMIYAPEDSAVADWARRRAYPDYATPQTADAITEFVESLKIDALWRKKAAISRRFAVTEFDPHRIQKIFEEGLTRGAHHYEARSTR